MNKINTFFNSNFVDKLKSDDFSKNKDTGKVSEKTLLISYSLDNIHIVSYKNLLIKNSTKNRTRWKSLKEYLNGIAFNKTIGNESVDIHRFHYSLFQLFHMIIDLLKLLNDEIFILDIPSNNLFIDKNGNVLMEVNRINRKPVDDNRLSSNSVCRRKILKDELLSKLIDTFQIELMENLKNKKKNCFEIIRRFYEDISFLTIDNLSYFETSWAENEISNFVYLLILNRLSGRRLSADERGEFDELKKDYTNYVIMPWITDYEINDDGNFIANRDLTKSKFQLNKGENLMNNLYESLLENHTSRMKISRPIDNKLTHTTIPHHITESIISNHAFYTYCARSIDRLILQRECRKIWEPKEYPSSLSALYANSPCESIIDLYGNPQIFRSIHKDMTHLLVEDGEDGIIDEFEICEKSINLLNNDLYIETNLHLWIDLIFGEGMLLQNASVHSNIFVERQHRILFKTAHTSKRLKPSTKLEDSKKFKKIFNSIKSEIISKYFQPIFHLIYESFQIIHHKLINWDIEKTNRNCDECSSHGNYCKEILLKSCHLLSDDIYKATTFYERIKRYQMKLEEIVNKLRMDENFNSKKLWENLHNLLIFQLEESFPVTYRSILPTEQFIDYNYFKTISSGDKNLEKIFCLIHPMNFWKLLEDNEKLNLIRHITDKEILMKTLKLLRIEVDSRKFIYSLPIQSYLRSVFGLEYYLDWQLKEIFLLLKTNLEDEELCGLLYSLLFHLIIDLDPLVSMKFIYSNLFHIISSSYKENDEVKLLKFIDKSSQSKHLSSIISPKVKETIVFEDDVNVYYWQYFLLDILSFYGNELIKIFYIPNLKHVLIPSIELSITDIIVAMDTVTNCLHKLEYHSLIQFFESDAKDNFSNVILLPILMHILNVKIVQLSHLENDDDDDETNILNIDQDNDFQLHKMTISISLKHRQQLLVKFVTMLSVICQIFGSVNSIRTLESYKIIPFFRLVFTPLILFTLYEERKENFNRQDDIRLSLNAQSSLKCLQMNFEKFHENQSSNNNSNIDLTIIDHLKRLNDDASFIQENCESNIFYKTENIIYSNVLFPIVIPKEMLNEQDELKDNENSNNSSSITGRPNKQNMRSITLLLTKSTDQSALKLKPANSEIIPMSIPRSPSSSLSIRTEHNGNGNSRNFLESYLIIDEDKYHEIQRCYSNMDMLQHLYLLTCAGVGKKYADDLIFGSNQINFLNKYQQIISINHSDDSSLNTIQIHLPIKTASLDRFRNIRNFSLDCSEYSNFFKNSFTDLREENCEKILKNKIISTFQQYQTQIRTLKEIENETSLIIGRSDGTIDLWNMFTTLNKNDMEEEKHLNIQSSQLNKKRKVNLTNVVHRKRTISDKFPIPSTLTTVETSPSKSFSTFSDIHQTSIVDLLYFQATKRVASIDPTHLEIWDLMQNRRISSFNNRHLKKRNVQVKFEFDEESKNDNSIFPIETYRKKIITKSTDFFRSSPQLPVEYRKLFNIDSHTALIVMDNGDLQRFDMRMRYIDDIGRTTYSNDIVIATDYSEEFNQIALLSTNNESSNTVRIFDVREQKILCEFQPFLYKQSLEADVDDFLGGDGDELRNSDFFARNCQFIMWTGGQHELLTMSDDGYCRLWSTCPIYRNHYYNSFQMQHPQLKYQYSTWKTTSLNRITSTHRLSDDRYSLLTSINHFEVLQNSSNRSTYQLSEESQKLLTNFPKKIAAKIHPTTHIYLPLNEVIVVAYDNGTNYRASFPEQSQCIGNSSYYLFYSDDQ
ncbi:hypothetical protein SNEBB_003034 [Seison nebaliae]|nr:hypothetical protein SNEBB_003034 [Seison nebaliae]